MNKLIQWFVRKFKGRLVKKLIEGSRNIDRRRTEIDQVINMILGMPCLAHMRSCRNTVHWIIRTKANRTEDYIWILLSDSDGRLKASFNCGDRELPTSYYSSEYGSKMMKMKHVEVTHGHLGLFVEKMMESYPDLQKELRPLINAA